MHHAPALTLVLQADPLWRRGVCAGSLAGLLVLWVWLAWHGTHTRVLDWQVLTVASLSAIAPLWLLRRTWVERSVSTLRWQPAQGLWLLETISPDVGAAPRPGRLDCMVAGQHWLLLRHSGPQVPTTWIPISRRAHPADWHALRCAVFSPGAIPPQPAPPADE